MFHAKLWLSSTRLQRKEAIVFGKCPPYGVADHGTTQRPILLVEQATNHSDGTYGVHLAITHPPAVKVVGEARSA